MSKKLVIDFDGPNWLTHQRPLTPAEAAAKKKADAQDRWALQRHLKAQGKTLKSISKRG